MPPHLRFCLVAALPATAVVSLLCGPSPAAAQAAHRAQLARQKSAEQAAKNATCDSAAAPSNSDRPATDEPASSPSEPRGEEPIECSYLAPAAAKPGESKKVFGKTALVCSPIPTYPDNGAYRVCVFAPVEPFWRPHHPAYRAQAPPHR